jgi:hypothetical protein
MPSIPSSPVPERHFDSGLDEGTRSVFESIRVALERDGVDPFDRDAFLMHRSVVELIHGGRPTGSVGEAIDEFTALTHLFFLFWLDGENLIVLDDAALEAVMSGPRRSEGQAARPVVFVGIGPRRIWGSPTASGPEPLDGWYAARRDDRLMVAAMFGSRPDREDVSIVATSGPEPVGLVREDGGALFSPTLPGGAQAGLYSLTGMEELLALAWRVEHWRAGRA